MAYISLHIQAIGSETRELYKELKKEATQYCFCAGVRYYNDCCRDQIRMYDFCNSSILMRKAIDKAAAKLGITYIKVNEY